MSQGRNIGLWGEKIACRYLKGKGYQIRECNFCCRWGEIDIIAQDMQGKLIFFEIKTRTSSVFGQPMEAVTLQKQLKILKTVYTYLNEYPVFIYQEYAIDVIAVYLNIKLRKARIMHLKNAFSDVGLEIE